MLHLKNVMSSKYPQSKVITPTMVDINFNVVETMVDDIKMFEYETYRFEDFTEYLAWQNNSLEKDIESLMFALLDITKKVGV